MKNFANLMFGVLFAGSILFVAVPWVNAQDAATADAKHYKVMFENDQVRVLRVAYGTKEKSVMHQHPDSVAVSLTGMQGKFTSADGKAENRTFKAGEVRWSPAEVHTPENAGGKPFEVILVELKAPKGGGTSTNAAAAADDPLKTAAEHHKLEFENDRVRVLRGKVGPGEKTGMHGHPGNVVIVLSDVRVRNTLADGKTEETSAKAGEALWREPLKHVSENIGDKPFEVIIVELKGN